MLAPRNAGGENSREKSQMSVAHSRDVDDLIDADRVVLIGPIVAEVLLGFRRKARLTGWPHGSERLTFSRRPGMIGRQQPRSVENSPRRGMRFPSPTSLSPPSPRGLTLPSIQPIHTSISSQD